MASTHQANRVLIVDDEPDIVFLLKSLLTTTKDVEVLTASSGCGALNILNETTVNLLITDIMMPGMNGIELVSLASESDPDLQCIVMTGNGDIDSAIEAMQMGAVNYLCKPLNFEELLLAIEHALQKSELGKRLKTSELQLRKANKDLEKKVAKRTADLAKMILDLKIYEEIFNSSNDSIIITDAMGIIHRVNPGFLKMTGYREEEIIGQNPRILQSGLHDQQFYHSLWHSLTSKGEWRGEIYNKKKNGEIISQLMQIKSIHKDNISMKQYVGISCDITELKKREEKISAIAYYDSLTGLSNRYLLNEHINLAIGQAKRHAEIIAVIFLDLDKFKPINDTFGHQTGDRVLKVVAERIKDCVRKEDICYRLGGDEFVVVLGRLKYKEAVLRLQERLCADIKLPITFHGAVHQVSVSIGIAFYPEDGNTSVALVSQADSAMYRQKKSRSVAAELC